MPVIIFAAAFVIGSLFMPYVDKPPPADQHTSVRYDK